MRWLIATIAVLGACSSDDDEGPTTTPIAATTSGAATTTASRATDPTTTAVPSTSPTALTAAPARATTRVVSQNILHGMVCAPETNGCQLADRIALFMQQLADAACPELVAVPPEMRRLLESEETDDEPIRAPRSGLERVGTHARCDQRRVARTNHDGRLHIGGTRADYESTRRTDQRARSFPGAFPSYPS